MAKDIQTLKMIIEDAPGSLLQQYAQRATDVYAEKKSSDDLRLDEPDTKKHADFKKALDVLNEKAGDYTIPVGQAHTATVQFEKALRAFGKEEVDPQLSEINGQIKELDTLMNKGGKFDREFQHLDALDARGSSPTGLNIKTMSALEEQIKAISGGLAGKVSAAEPVTPPNSPRSMETTVTPTNTPENSRPSTPTNSMSR